MKAIKMLPVSPNKEKSWIMSLLKNSALIWYRTFFNVMFSVADYNCENWWKKPFQIVLGWLIYRNYSTLKILEKLFQEKMSSQNARFLTVTKSNLLQVHKCINKKQCFIKKNSFKQFWSLYFLFKINKMNFPLDYYIPATTFKVFSRK